MKKKYIILILILILFVITLFLSILFKFKIYKPFELLKKDNIVDVYVCALPDNNTTLLDKNQTEELVQNLNNVIVFCKDENFKGYLGQAFVFTILTTSRTSVEIVVSKPSLILINGIPYKTRYKDYEKLYILGEKYVFLNTNDE